MRVGIIIFPGSNCDQDLKTAIESLGVQTDLLWYNNQIKGKYDLLCIPGGFSYGDYLRSGALASRSRVMKELEDANNRGVPILGICNGFQVLTESNLLPGALLKNQNLRHICKDVKLTGAGLFDKLNFENYTLPVSHSEGNYYCNENDLRHLVQNQQIFFRYQQNVNGSIEQIAGITNEKKNVFGLMPHPERAFCDTLDRPKRSKGQDFFEQLFNILNLS
jgi:phosphoribosylformylglycinamidine synthase subunit PurQ / glutaminase